MSKLIVMPDGNAVSPDVIKSVQLIKNRVVCFDAQKRLVVWIEVPDDERGKRVRHILTSIVNEGRRAQQPDWSFLEEGV